MSDDGKKRSPRYKGELGPDRGHRPLELAAIGLEAEFMLFVNDEQVKPEDEFGDPRGFIRSPLLHREGTSYHLPTGGAVYFDTGVIEVATPAIEIARGCAARAGRSLWESILYLRTELDAWERRSGKHARLVGFSTHYNISFETQDSSSDTRRTTAEHLAHLLIHILPVPVMLIAANRRSTGIGVRPRGERVEVTADFTPSPALMIATATFLTGTARSVMSWPSYDLNEARDRGLPLLRDFTPIPHTTRTGWVARPECFAANPFKTRVDEKVWEEEDGTQTSLRRFGRDVFSQFRRAVRRISDPFSYRLLQSIFERDAPVLLDLPDRPDAYEDVGRLCFWDDLFPERTLSRSLYERVLIRAIAGDTLHINGRAYVPVGMRGWSEVVFERRPDRTRHRFTVDFLVQHLDRWERGR